MLVCIQVILTAISFQCFNRQILSCFTDSEAVKGIWAATAPIIFLNILTDHCQSFYQGVVRGLGVQDELVRTIVVIYWVINLPL